MIPISEWMDNTDGWMPVGLLVALLLALVLPRLAIIMLLPFGASRASHQLNRLYRFVEFS